MMDRRVRGGGALVAPRFDCTIQCLRPYFIPILSDTMMDKTLRPANLSPGRRIYAIGDVHGHVGRLRAMHARIREDLARRPVAKPLLLHLGDLIDRGPDSAGCIALLAGKQPLPGLPTVNLMGNHERMMLDALSGRSRDDVDRWLDNGGDKALWSWGLKSASPPRDWMAAIPASHLVLLRDLRTHWSVDNYMMVHAGVRPGVRLSEQREDDLLWIREDFLNWSGPMLPEAPFALVVHGHTPVVAPTVKANRIGLDTGAGKGGPLTCGVFEGEDVEFFQT